MPHQSEIACITRKKFNQRTVGGSRSPTEQRVRILIRLPVCSRLPVFVALNCRPSGVTTHLKLIASRSNTSLAGVKVNHKYEHVDCYKSTLSRINTKCSVNQVTAVIAGRSCPNKQYPLAATGPSGTQTFLLPKRRGYQLDK